MYPGMSIYRGQGLQNEIQAKYLNKAGDKNNNTEINDLCIFFLQQYFRKLCLETIKTKLNDLDYR